jgi:hypothetical protein
VARAPAERGQSTRAPSAASLSGAPPAVEAEAFALFDHLDTFSGVRNGLRRIAAMEQSWAGIPMPLQGRRLVIDPHFPRAATLSDLLVDHEKEARDADELKAAGLDNVKIRNRFWSFNRRTDVVIFEKDGKIDWGLDRGLHNVDRLVDTLDCSYAWGLEQESRAVHTLGTLLRHHHFKAYLLTGMFMEYSPRSRLTYLFRRLRPTVVLDTKSDPQRVKIRCCLCMHPIGYYEGTWAGAMTPTDDVISHLMMMRGDEPMLWRRANQHPAWRPEAGL